MNLVHPEMLLAAVASVAALVAAALWLARARRRAVARFASPELAARLGDTASRPRRALKFALAALGVAMAFAALARPRWGWRWEEARRDGVDILFAVDTSKSMLAEDVRPSRLARAKLAVHDLVDRFEGDRAGLVAFAGEAFLQAPMTLDRDAFGRALDALDTEVVPRPGTNVAAAIREARAAFGQTDHEKVLVLLTDGEALEGDAVDEAREAAREGMRIYAVGVGSPEGSLVPVRAPDGRTTLLRGPDGELVRSRLDEATLRQLATVTGGDYEPFGASGEGLRRLYERRLSTLPKHAVAERRHRVWYERFQVPLALAVAALALEALVGDRRRAFVARRARPAALAAMMLAALALPALAQAEGRPAAVYNHGVSAYRSGDYAAAATDFERALRVDDLALQERAYYNLGDARFRVGESTRERDRAATRTAWEAAARAYESALGLRSDDADARHNLDLVRRRLAELDREEHEQAQQNQQRQQGAQGQQQGAQGQQQGAQGQQQGAQGQQHGAQGQQQGAQGQQHGAQGQQHGAQGQQHGQQASSTDNQGHQGGDRGQTSGGQSQGDATQPNGSQNQGHSGDQQGRQPAEQGPQSAEQAPHGAAQAPQSAGQGPQQATNAPQADRQGQQSASNAQQQGAAGAQHAAQQRGAQQGSARDGGAPGARLTARDAVELLDSMRHEERRWPLAARAEAGAPSSSQLPRKDW